MHLRKKNDHELCAQARMAPASAKTLERFSGASHWLTFHRELTLTQAVRKIMFMTIR